MSNPSSICSSNSRLARRRRGLTLLELMVSITITTLIAGALGTLARAVQMSSDYTDGHSTAVQHAQVTLERITRSVNQAYANESFPGAVVFADTVSGWRFPDTLVTWRPAAQPTNPDGLPLFNELIVYCPNPTVPSQLVEITNPTDTRQVPALTATSTWTAELTALKASTSARKQLLTDMLRTATVTTGSGTPRGCVRFEMEQHPTPAQWATFRAGTINWEDVNWVQDIYGSQTGLAQTWVRIELQVVPPGANASNQPVLPFLDSAAIYYELHQ